MKIFEHSGAHLWLLTWRATRALARYDRSSIEAAGFRSMSDFAVLQALLHKGPMPVNRVGELVFLTSGSITAAVQRLEARGWLRRRRDEQDRRVTRVELTDEGRERIGEAFEDHADRLERLFAAFSDKEREDFAALMQKLHQQAEDAEV